MTLFDAEDAGDRSSNVDPEAGEGVPSRLQVRLRMTVAYDGTRFHGFAYNAGIVTVAGTLREALAKVLRQEIHITCAGRTDKGVHAWGQVVHLDVVPPEAEAFDLVWLLRSLNKMLAPNIVVREAALAPPGFDARRSATGRRYRYTVLNRPLPDPFLAATTWHVAEPLDLRAMQLACDPLIGEHDWSAFCRRPPVPRPPRQGGDPIPAGAVVPEPSLVRVVRYARWLELDDGLLRFDVEANAFCQQMVRSLVGTLVAVGRGRLRAGDIGGVLRSRDRALAAQPAPPQGLCLWEALYPPFGHDG